MALGRGVPPRIGCNKCWHSRIDRAGFCNIESEADDSTTGNQITDDKKDNKDI